MINNQGLSPTVYKEINTTGTKKRKRLMYLRMSCPRLDKFQGLYRYLYKKIF